MSHDFQMISHLPCIFDVEVPSGTSVAETRFAIWFYIFVATWSTFGAATGFCTPCRGGFLKVKIA
jgi:hypothetical protein